jgi:EAL domain-containing protein (putative c-di-GMP-specific phosphodiesterase class I)
MGKSLQSQNAIAVRQPTQTPAGPAAVATPNEPPTAESLGWQLRAALPPLRLHSLSLYDEEANVLWLSEGALGPDEHSVVVDAMDALGKDATLGFYESGLEDGRIAIFLPVRSPKGTLVGVAMVLADMKSVGDGVIERMISPQVRTIMQKIAVFLRSSQAATNETAAVKILELAPEPVSAVQVAPANPVDPAGKPPQALADEPARASTEKPVQALADRPAQASMDKPAQALVDKPAQASTDKPAQVPGAAIVPSTPEAELSPQAIDDILEFELTPDVPAPKLHSNTQTPPVLASVAEGSSTGPGVTANPSNPKTTSHTDTSVASGATGATTTSKTLGGGGTGTAKALGGGTGTANTLGGGTGTTKALNDGTTGTAKALGGGTGTTKALGSTNTSRVLTLPDGVTLALDIQPFTKLRPGGRTRRYEVIARSSHPNRVPAGLDKIALQQLLAWMGAHRAAWNLEPTSFTLNLSIATLEDERFPQFVASHLKANGIAADNIGFEIAEPLCLQRRAQVERFITLCDKLGCFVVIDDFSLDSSVVSLLRSKALRLVKIDSKLTSSALKDKLAQAMVVAIAQAVKVLGIHCAAKRVESQGSLQWLAAVGCDFAQGSAVEATQPLESLGAHAISA